MRSSPLSSFASTGPTWRGTLNHLFGIAAVAYVAMKKNTKDATIQYNDGRPESPSGKLAGSSSRVVTSTRLKLDKPSLALLHYQSFPHWPCAALLNP